MVRLCARAGFVVLGAFVGSAGCGGDHTSPRTELLLVTDTDIEALSSVTFEVRAEDHPTVRQSGDMQQDRSPLTLGVVRESGPLGPITTVAHGFIGDQEVITRVSVVSFVPGRTMVVPLHLLTSCLDVQCADDETCTETGCASATLAHDDLHDWTGAAPRVGTMDDAGSTGDAGLGDMPRADADTANYVGGEDGDAESPDGNRDATVAADRDASDASDAGATADGGNTRDASSVGDCGAAGSFDLAVDPLHCGACNYVCPTAHSEYHTLPTCVDSTCGYRCGALYGNCNQLLFVDFDGCETYLGNDPANCGTCGHKCTTSQSCILGVCTPF